MKRHKWMFSIVSAIALAVLNPPGVLGAGKGVEKKVKPADVTYQIQFVLDVALDGRTMAYSRPDAPQTGPQRGDSFVMNGRVFPGGTIPSGDTTNILSPDDDGSIGTLVIRGLFTVSAADIANGATRVAATNQQFYVDEGYGIVTEGQEGTVTVTRAVTGGIGQYSGAVGEVTEEVLGFNATGAVNLRFTFNLVAVNPQDPVFSRANPR